MGHCVKKGLLWAGPAPPQISSENTHSHLDIGCPSVGVEYHVCAEALISSLNCTTPRHAEISKALLPKQIRSLNLAADALIVAN